MSVARARSELQYEVEQFLYHEAALLDDRRLEEWLDLWTDDGQNILLCREKAQRKFTDEYEEGGPVQVMYEDDKHFMVLRVKRLDTNLAHSEKPPSFTRRLITNVQITGSEGDQLHVRSHFQVYQARLELEDYTFYGKREDVLRQVDGQWKIARRRTLLDHLVIPRAITIFF